MTQLTVELTPQAMSLLKHLDKLGLFGIGVNEVAVRLIDQGLIKLLESGMVQLPKANQGKPRQ
jgi:hypothetical protein